MLDCVPSGVPMSEHRTCTGDTFGSGESVYAYSPLVYFFFFFAAPLWEHALVVGSQHC